MNSNNQAPYRIVKKVVHHGGHHGGAWKVAYADFVTAMMALFIVLWIIGQSDQVKHNIARYFQSPGVFKEGGSSILTGDRQQIVDPLRSQIDPIQSSAKQQYALIQKMREEKSLREAGQHLQRQIQSMPNLQKLADQIQIKMTADGLRVELLENANSEFFELAGAVPKPATIELLRIIAKELGRLPNTLSLEGHTDSRPFVSRIGYSNWELSADRANSVRRIMQAGGLRPEQVEAVRGYADRQLLVSDNPLDMRNRRVSILVRFGDILIPPSRDLDSIVPSPEKQNPGAPPPSSKSHGEEENKSRP